LREQRVRQQKRAQEAEKEKAKTPKACPPTEKERRLHNPLPRRDVLARHLIHRGVASHQDVTSVQSHALASAYETLASPPLRQRTKIRQLWHGRYLYESMKSFPRASRFYHRSRWRDYQVPDGLYCSWDLTCKFRLHPSARTFDVAMADETTQLPHIATAVQGGLLLLQHGLERSSHHRVNCLHRYVLAIKSFLFLKFATHSIQFTCLGSPFSQGNQSMPFECTSLRADLEQ
jgi:hypothetical protein